MFDLLMHVANNQYAVSRHFTYYDTRFNVGLDAHAIYLLNLLLAFLQPKFDPSLQSDLLDEIEEGGDPVSPLPSQRDDEFRPFVRRLPEWQFWYVLGFFVSGEIHHNKNLGCLLHVQLSSPCSVHSSRCSMFPSTGRFLLYISSRCLP